MTDNCTFCAAGELQGMTSTEVATSSGFVEGELNTSVIRYLFSGTPNGMSYPNIGSAPRGNGLLVYMPKGSSNLAHAIVQRQGLFSRYYIDPQKPITMPIYRLPGGVNNDTPVYFIKYKPCSKR